ncbi:MAG: patatin-like phospholipase family protein [Xylophilus ampelinus]
MPPSTHSLSPDAPPPAAAPPRPAVRRPINLALQGGGSHGAFTWGVLDALLEDDRLEVDGISGASAGAVNAVAVAHGFAQAKGRGAAEAHRQARASLDRVWRGVAQLGSLGAMAQGMVRMLMGGWSPEKLGAGAFGGAMSALMSPYQANPLGINPLRGLLEQEIDFAAIGRLAVPRVFVSATHVRTGRAEIFDGKRLTLDAVLASTCLPTVFQAVEIDGEHYWDGGFAANPALQPLITGCAAPDIVLVQLNPLQRDAVPQSAQDIEDRVNELTFNASLLSQMRSIDFINRMLDSGHLREGDEYRSLFLHRIDGGEAMGELPASSKLSTDPAMIDRLFALGRQAANHWLHEHAHALGRRTTIDIRRDYVGNLPRGV